VTQATIGAAGLLLRYRVAERSNRMAGTMDKMKGAAKEGVGKVTGDTKLEAEGKTDKMKGDLKNAAHDAKEAAEGVKESLRKD
jgi:uncharacterized protein YjbJ (UPF0337 family)